MCDNLVETKTRTFVAIGTSHQTPPNSEYIGSAHLSNGELVFRVFETPI